MKIKLSSTKINATTCSKEVFFKIITIVCISLKLKVVKTKHYYKVIFDAHIKFLWSKVAQKLSALSRINKYFSYNQKVLFVNSVIQRHLPIVL